MPASSASRGVEKETGCPSTRKVPLVGLCTPDSVLMRVDLPAPLSPRRQSTSPRRTFMETPASATTGPKCFTRSRTSISGTSEAGMAASLMAGTSSAFAGGAAADVAVEQHGGEQHQAEKHLEPVV